MKYFDLQYTIDLNSSGRIPQAVSTDRSEFNSVFSSVQISPERLLDEIPLFELELEAEANITDILSSYTVPFGLLVSAKLKNLLCEFRLPPHRFHQINLIDRGILRNDYFWFHCFDDLWKYIDPSISTLEVYHKFNRSSIGEIPLHSSKQIREIRNMLEFEQDIRLKDLYFSRNIPSYDIIMNNIFGLYLWISETLKKALETEGITGYDIREVTALREWGKEQGTQSQGLK